MIDKVSGKVAYAVMSFGGFMGIGDRYHPLPWSVLTYDTQKGGYTVDLDRGTLERTPAARRRSGATATGVRRCTSTTAHVLTGNKGLKRWAAGLPAASFFTREDAAGAARESGQLRQARRSARRGVPRLASSGPIRREWNPLNLGWRCSSHCRQRSRGSARSSAARSGTRGRAPGDGCGWGLYLQNAKSPRRSPNRRS
jgi:hypothetical protein